MKGFLSSIERLCRVSIWLCGALVLFMAFYICVDVLMRKIFAVSIRGGDEFSGYVLAIMSGWGFVYAFLNKNHIRIDVIYLKTSLKFRSVLDVFSLLALIAFVFPLAYYSFGVLKTSWIRKSLSNTPLQTPLWIPQSLWFFGLLFFSFVLAVFLGLTLYNLSKGNLAEAYKLAGSTTLEEEIEDLKEGKVK
ncbi:MAG: TRAP transporter small permease [Synergistetes bacterium]|nr:TRAP transporter small permease [Synergistota bacterium]MCX8127473.1 TRAP transporter small permease [Synergistota bacterium]MDW8192750.1 TRAP transporter small permease [Synergistota bacterium]